MGLYKKRHCQTKKASEIWREFARLKGLQEQPADAPVTILSFQGRNRDLPVFLKCFATEGKPVRVGDVKVKRARGQEVHIFSQIKIILTGLPPGIRVYRETAWHKFGKVLGIQDIKTDDPSFDQKFIIKGTDPKGIIDYLTPSRRKALLKYADELQGLELHENSLVLLQPGQIESMDRLNFYFSKLGLLTLELARS